MEEKNKEQEPVKENGTEEKTKMSTGRKLVISLITVLLVLTAAAYGYGVYYFSGHFLPGTLVNGFNCSYIDQAETEKLLEKKTRAYVLAIRTRGNDQESMTAEEIGLVYQSDGSVKNLMHDQNRFLWFLSFGQHSALEVPPLFLVRRSFLSRSFRASSAFRIMYSQ